MTRPGRNDDGGGNGAGRTEGDANRCPFLKEAEVRFCRASVYRKMIVGSPGSSGGERCSTGDYVSCPAARQQGVAAPAASRSGASPAPHCPFLQDVLVQYCAAASITRFIPASEAGVTRCGQSSYHFCDLYLSLAEPRPEPLSWGNGGEDDEPDPESHDVQVGRVKMPRGLSWSENHMWLEESEDGYCHIGVDGFMADVLGRVDDLNFPVVCGLQRPAVVLRVNGVDFHMNFPARLFITAVNSRLKATPERLLLEPYRQGWLIEGRTRAWGDDSRTSGIPGLRRGREAVRWMQDEIERFDRFVHDEVAHGFGVAGGLAADGGSAVAGIAQKFHRDALLRLFNEFFSPGAGAGSGPGRRS